MVSVSAASFQSTHVSGVVKIKLHFYLGEKKLFRHFFFNPFLVFFPSFRSDLTVVNSMDRELMHFDVFSDKIAIFYYIECNLKHTTD